MLMKPSFFMICTAQSMEPLYLTPPPEDIRPAVTVTAQPRRKEAATEESFPPMRIGFRVSNRALMVSLKAKFRAWVGKYLSTLARFPLQKGTIPSVANTLLVQSRTPV